MGMEEDFQKFLEVFLEATRRIESHYFQLPIAGKKEAAYRERVYCYELYHQIRTLMPDDFQYVINGEVDKAGHPLYRKGPKPDFIIHVPREMNKNLVVMEVKPLTANAKAIRKDLETLYSFLDDAGYFKAVYLIYGDGQNEKFKKFETIKRTIKRKTCRGLPEESVRLIWHQGPTRRAIVKGSDGQIG